MIKFLLIIQLLLLFLQVLVFTIGLIRKENMFKFCFGFAIWGCIPNIFIMLLVASL